MSVRLEVTSAQIADALGQTANGIVNRAAREGWPYRTGGERRGGTPGRRPRLYEVSALPAGISELFEPARRLAESAPELLRRLEVSTAELIDYRDAMRAECTASGRIPDAGDECEISSLSVEIERNCAAIARARGVEGAKS